MACGKVRTYRVSATRKLTADIILRQTVDLRTANDLWRLDCHDYASLYHLLPPCSGQNHPSATPDAVVELRPVLPGTTGDGDRYGPTGEPADTGQFESEEGVDHVAIAA